MLRLWFETPENYIDLEIYELGLQFSQPYVRVRRADGCLITCSSTNIRRPTDLSITIPRSSILEYRTKTNLARCLRTVIENNSTFLLFEGDFTSAYQLKLTDVSPVLLGNPILTPEFTDELYTINAAVIETGYYTNFEQKSSYIPNEVN